MNILFARVLKAIECGAVIEALKVNTKARDGKKM